MLLGIKLLSVRVFLHLQDLCAREYCTEHFSILGFLLLLDQRSSYLLGAIINHFLTIMTGDRGFKYAFLCCDLHYILTQFVFYFNVSVMET